MAYYLIVFFILGTILSSFYNVVGFRLPRGESIVFPPSHCPKCNHKLSPIELIPIFSFLIQKGKCKNCHEKISWFYPLFELFGGILFSLAYLSFGFTLELLLALTFISLTLIIMVSDYNYLIINDSVLIVFSILLAIQIFFIRGFNELIIALLSGVICFVIMFLIKKLGDFLFKKESMGGGDIKLMFIFGLVFKVPAGLANIFIGALIGLPISLLILYRNKSHVVPFGPFLCLASLILLLLQIDSNTILLFLTEI